MKRNDFGSKLRRLCALGLDEHALIPKFLEYLHHYVDSESNSYVWVDKRGELINGYAEKVEYLETLPVYVENFQNSNEVAVFDGPSSLRFSSAVDMDRVWLVGRDEMVKHSYYHEILKPSNFGYGAQRRVCVNGRVHGAIQLHRPPTGRRFGKEELRKVDIAVAHLEYALGHPNSMTPEFSNVPSKTEFLYTDARGNILNVSKGALKLLALCQYEDRFSHARHSPAKSPLIRSAIDGLYSKEALGSMVVPSYQITNIWGRFRVTLFQMKSAMSAYNSDYICMQLEQYEASKVSVMDNLESFALTERQKEVGVWLSQGRPYAGIAKELGVAKSTIVSHKKEIFARVGVTRLHEFIDRIHNVGA